MSEWIEVAAEDSFRRQTRVDTNGKVLALFRLDDGIYATDDSCSHEYSPLSEGEIWDDDVYCPKHGSRFDIRTGAVRSFPALKPVGSYPVKVEDGKVYVRLD